MSGKAVMNDNETEPVMIRLLDQEYQVACSRVERDALLAAARFLDGKMKEIQKTGRVIGTDRIAVMAALNMAYELLEDKARREEYAKSMNSRIRSLQEKIDLVLQKEVPGQ